MTQDEKGKEGVVQDGPVNNATKDPKTGFSGIVTLLINGFMAWFKTKKAKAAIIGFLCITGGLAGLFSYQASQIKVVSLADAIAGSAGGGGGNNGGKDPFSKFTDEMGSAPLTGTAQEGETDSQSLNIEDFNVFEVTITLTWTDEPDSARHTNQPDTFEIKAISPDNRSASQSGTNPQGGEGSIELVFSRNVTTEALADKELKKKSKEMAWTGEWTIDVTCSSAGDQKAMFSIFGLRDQQDSGNKWDMEISWSFKAEP